MTDKQKQLIMDYQNTFLSEHGQRVYEDLMFRSGYSTLIPPNDLAIYNLGKRDLFMYIMDKVECDINREAQTEAEIE